MSIVEGQRIKGYSEQVIKYCYSHNITVPCGFHNRTTSKFILIESSIEMKKLIALSFDYDNEVILYLNKEESKNIKFNIFNFKNCYQYYYKGGIKLVKGDKFECKKELYSFSLTII